MKLRLFALGLTALALPLSTATAVTVGFIGTPSPGTATVDGSNVDGRAVFVATSTNIAGDIPGAFASILGGGGSSADFDAALASLLGSAGGPGVVKTAPFTAGAFFSNSNEELGDVGNSTYMFVVGESGGSVSGIGAYQGTNVPSLGAVSITPGTDTPALGTSNGGFQLAPVVPEPSVAILGALGVLGLLRRRR